MAKIDRRQLMSLSGAAGMAALLPAVTIPGAPALAKAQHSLKSGAFEVLTFSDGYLSLNPRMAAPNADPEKYKAAQAAAALCQGWWRNSCKDQTRNKDHMRAIVRCLKSCAACPT